MEDNLEFASNSYKSELKRFKNPNEAIRLIDQKYFLEQEIEIEKYNNLSKQFINKFYSIPEASISSIIFRVIGAGLCFGISQSDAKLSISLTYILFGILIIIFLIRRLIKTYGNKIYDEMENLYYEIDHDQYHKIQVLSNRIQNSLIKLWLDREDLRKE